MEFHSSSLSINHPQNTFPKKMSNETSPMEIEEEPILAANPNRFVIKPIRYDDIWDMYKKAVASFWTLEEVDLSDDLVHWRKLTKNEQHFIKHTLAYFVGADGIVNENLFMNFISEVQIPEARYFYGFQIAMENIHSETYAELIETYINDEHEKQHLFNAIEEVPCVKKKAEWAFKHFNRDGLSFAKRLVAFACIEGIFFSASFATIFWLKERGIMPGLTFTNELISRDEALHTDFACLLYSKLVNKLTYDQVKEIVLEAVAIEQEFATQALPCRLVGINSGLMKKYIEFVGDHLLQSLGYPKHYQTKNPLKFMERISRTVSITNFFEKKVSQYSKAGVGVNKDEETFKLIMDF